ncbi:MAG TPA: SUMF1/EgtB/PvdO family nonheme iron enzyme [Acidobacteriota bacterium]|jgi:formylglycine-generating enzyme required for sulfatase activity
MSSVIEPEMILIEGGPVTLGLPEFPPGAQVPHKWTRKEVDVPAFWIAKYAVTVLEYLAFAEASRYEISEQFRQDPRFRNTRQPAGFVSWIDAVRYAQRLSRETGKPYRLVRDAEYEKASRGGLIGRKYPWGDDEPDGHCDFNNPQGSPRPVGSFHPNGYGLYDMVGSIWSWCEECFNQVAYPDQAKMIYEDTQIRDVRLNPICRGGSYKTADTNVLYCAYRHEDPTDGRFDCIGFRLACDAH